MQKRCIIIASALEDECSVEHTPSDFLIAADAGYLCCQKHNIIPDMVVGDFDSMCIEELEGAACEHIKLPCAKDDTDTLAAIRIGLQHDCNEFHIYGGISTDMAHSFANFQCLDFCEEKGTHAFLHTEGQVSQLVTKSRPLIIDDCQNKRLSVFAWGDSATGVNISGTRWELDNETLTSAFPVGVSNVVTSNKAQISVSTGKLLCILG